MIRVKARIVVILGEGRVLELGRDTWIPSGVAGQILFLDLAGVYKGVPLITSHYTLYLFCMVFCICILQRKGFF